MGVFGTSNTNTFIGAGNPPKVVLGAGVGGTGATIDVKGTNGACTVTIVTGVNVSTGGDLFSLTLADGAAMPNTLRPGLTAYNLTTANMATSIYPANITTNSYTVKCGSVSLAAGSVIIITCHNIGD